MRIRCGYIGHGNTEQYGEPSKEYKAAYTAFLNRLLRYKIIVLPVGVMMPRLPELVRGATTGAHLLLKP